MRWLFWSASCVAGIVLGSTAAFAQSPAGYPGGAATCDALPARAEVHGIDRRVICADVAALDHMLVYNRFGSYNPFGMMFALRRDLVPAATPPAALGAEACADDAGVAKEIGALAPGEVRLRDCKRPRPMVLRANEGDLLAVQVTNLLRPAQPGHSETFCRSGGIASGTYAAEIRGAVAEGAGDRIAHHEASCLAGSAGLSPEDAAPGDADWPATRGLTFAIQGLVAVEAPAGLPATDVDVCRGLAAIAPGEAVTCYYEVDRAGPYFFSSNAAPSGGEGDGGSITHGLFGAVVAQDDGSEWYRSQVSRAALDLAWPPVGGDLAARLSAGDHRRTGQIDYEVAVDGIPVLNMARIAARGAREIVHTDLNAIVHDPADGDVFREFSVFFHDELKTFYTRNFEDLGRYGQLAGVRDGFAINYGASGMGSILLANRKGIGPAAGCVECLYEEFFLTSWANGDPALLERYADDPSNVHHSYLNDEIRFRNFHAGPKETHVFHLHAHQWFAGNDGNRGAYLDSQTVAPQQGFTYNIYSGGLSEWDEGEPDPWLGNEGSGNRNRTVGDSIFHCHLYPHFAQGMWELWRVHDVFEDGTRLLPDGQPAPGLSVAATPGEPRIGSVDPETGRWNPEREGTPVPALVPLPGRPLPVLPTYADEKAEAYLTADGKAAFPGYPFFVAGRPGHRPPQAPMDLARKLDADGGIGGGWLDGGLNRHVVTGGTRTYGVSEPGDPPPANEAQASQLLARMLALGDMTAHFDALEIEPLDPEGTPLERAAMGFHHNGQRWAGGGVAPAQVAVARPDGTPAVFNPAGGGYDTGTGAGASLFTVNGAPPKPGAPFADPCGAPDGLARGAPVADPFVSGASAPLPFRPDPAVGGFRRYEASAVQLDLIANRAGWHDPQARINVLTARSDDYKVNNSGLADPISPFVSAREEPFFFRAYGTECIEFRHTNELPKELELDDFQVKTPTDTIGQHIHLVKFDVTASDGSGNGWNYEDGTFAPDEVAARICAQPGATDPRCAMPEYAAGRLWTLKRSEHPELFQTTAQRWFADPILSPLGPEGSDGKADRTLRTVFSHDHFGPSSIQQHGFYTALVIEPADVDVCHPGTPAAGTAPDCQSFAGSLGEIADDNEVMVGTHRVLLADQADNADPDWPGPDSIHPDVREYALAVADFAVLYDPRDFDTDVEAVVESGSPQGIARLACEARHWGLRPTDLDGAACGSGLASDVNGHFDGDDPIPAWNAAGRPGDAAGHTGDLAAMLDAGDATALLDHLRDYRERASLGTDGRMAAPVAPPARPESISVDHHDPYLVNYRGEPIPLRVATKEGGDPADCALASLPVQGERDPAADDAALVRDARKCSYAVQRPGEEGDMSNLFLSSLHGDPATLPLETYSGERTYVRMIQGAQEVQHMFSIEGYSWRRNLDQPFPQAAPALGGTPSEKTAKQVCNELAAVRQGYPEFYRAYFEGRIDRTFSDGSTAPPAVRDYFAAFADASARCLNIEGYAQAQEIGISEHFEVAGSYRQQLGGGVLNFEAPSREDLIPLRPGVAYRRDSTDYLYSYGTQDALWNGAWGFLRVFRDAESPDLTACMRKEGATLAGCTAPASARFGTIEGLRSLRAADGDAGLAPPPPAPDTLVLPCKADAPKVTAAVAAIEARKVYGAEGMRYGTDMYDPDGLLLATLDPALAVEGAARADLEGAIRASLAGQPAEPYVLTVRAGDCVTLKVVNLLEPAPGASGLADGFGDARMPPITPLNTDPPHETTREAAAGVQRIEELAADPAAPRRNDLTPSARLALRFSLPTLNEAQRMALPFGWNATGALAPAGTEITFRDDTPETESPTGFLPRPASAEEITFYAGKLSVDPAEPETAHWMPYAFGAVPIKPFGDVIGHGAHGLIGAILVLPQDWTLEDGSAPGSDRTVAPAPIRGGHGQSATQPPVLDVTGAYAETRHRSFVLFWQDGLNLRDRRTALHWHYAGTQANVLDADGTMTDFVPDCGICDDSYDRGDQGVSYHSAPFFARLRDTGRPAVAGTPLERDSDLNAVAFPPDFWMLQPAEAATGSGGWGAPKQATSMPVLRAEAGEEVTISVVQPSGRARQHAVVTISQDYDDLFPGFGFPHSALMSPGKAVNAPLTLPVREGCYLWHDGPAHLRAGGIWGLIDVVPEGMADDATVSSCRRG